MIKKFWIGIVILISVLILLGGWIGYGLYDINSEWTFPYITKSNQMQNIYEKDKIRFNKIKEVLYKENVQTGFMLYLDESNPYRSSYKKTIEQEIPAEIVMDFIYLVEEYKINDFFVSETYICFEQVKPVAAGENSVNIKLIYDNVEKVWISTSSLNIGRKKNVLIYKLYQQLYGREIYMN